MKKILIIIILFSLFLGLFQETQAKVEIDLAFSFVYNQFSHVDLKEYADDYSEYWNNWYKAIKIEDTIYSAGIENESGVLFDYELEIRAAFFPRFFFGLSYEIIPYIEFGLENKFKDNDFELKDYYTYYNMYMEPICLSTYYQITGDKFILYSGIGLECYRGTIQIDNQKNEINENKIDKEPSGYFRNYGYGICFKAVNIEWAVGKYFSFIGGVSFRLGKISGLQNESGEKEILYAYDYYIDGNTYRRWAALKKEDIHDFKDNNRISNFKEAAIDMTGFKIFIGVVFKFRKGCCFL